MVESEFLSKRPPLLGLQRCLSSFLNAQRKRQRKKGWDRRAKSAKASIVSEDTEAETMHKLRFNEVARDEFAYLTSLGFVARDFGENQVRFSRDDFDILLSFSDYTFETHLDVVRLEKSYSLGLLIGISNTEVARAERAPTSTTDTQLRISLRKVRDTFQECSPPLFENPEVAFAAMDERRSKWEDEYAAEVMLARELPKADKTFREKRYDAAAQIYSTISESLSPAHKKKLT